MKLIHVLVLTLFVAVLLALLSKTTKINNKISKEIYGNNPLKGKYYTVNGFRMYCEIYGSGEPLLMIHGNGGSINAFRKQIPYFSRRFKVIVADSRAQGKSVDYTDSLSYELMADDFSALLIQLKIDSANVMGWSDGGINALQLAIRHPQQVKKLVITGANLQPDSTVVEPAILKEIMPDYTVLKNRFASKTAVSTNDSTKFKLLKLLIEQPHIPLTALHKISSPALVIGGDRDIIKPSHTLEMFQHLPKAYLWILPHSGHATLIEYAEEFNKKASDFLRKPYNTRQKHF